MKEKPHLSPFDLGIAGESEAEKYLKKHKYRIEQKGFRLYRGEIDIIAYDRSTLVFIEVKARRTRKFGFPEESVTPAKEKQLRKIAEAYLALNGIEDIACRFDVISLLYDEFGLLSLRHIKDAF